MIARSHLLVEAVIRSKSVSINMANSFPFADRDTRNHLFGSRRVRRPRLKAAKMHKHGRVASRTVQRAEKEGASIAAVTIPGQRVHHFIPQEHSGDKEAQFGHNGERSDSAHDAAI